MDLTNDEVLNVLDVKYIAGSTNGYEIPVGIYEISHNNLMLKSLLPNKPKVNFTIDDIRLRPNLTTNKTIKFTEKSFFYTILGFAQSHSIPSNDIEGSVQLTVGSYKSEKPINTTGINKVHVKIDCIVGSIVNIDREPILYSFTLFSPPSHILYEEPRAKLFE